MVYYLDVARRTHLLKVFLYMFFFNEMVIDLIITENMHLKIEAR